MFFHFWRILEVLSVLIKYGIVDLLIPITSSFFLRSLLNSLRVFCRKKEKLGVRIRNALEELGPIFVKFGQNLSTRPDLIPIDITNELVKLQENVPPFAWMQAKNILEKSLGKPIDQVFKTINEEAIASASIAQVHEARLLNGEIVVVKIVRPNIQKTIKNDLALMRFLAHWTTKFWPAGKRLRLPELVQEYKKVLHWELDLMREAANASQLRSNFEKAQNILYIPKIYWDFCRKDVMVMEKIEGIRVNDIESLNRHNINLKKLAHLGVEIFFTQVFRDNLFHADMHPGNILVAKNSPDSPGYIGIDFGIVGSLNPSDQQYLAENFMAFFNKDYRRVAQLHVESGWVRSDVRVDEFESAIRTVCEPIFHKQLHEISFGRLLVSLFQTVREFDMEIQPQLILLQKTLLNIEGLGRQLYPQLDLWETAKPLLEKWMKEVKGPIAQLKKTRQNIYHVSKLIPQLSESLAYTLQQKKDVSRNRKEIAYLKKCNLTLFFLLIAAVSANALIWMLFF